MTMPTGDIYHEIITDSRNGLFRPALGSSWHHCITTRFVLHNSRAQNPSLEETVRSVHSTVFDIVKSPLVSNYRDQIFYEIDKAGIVIDEKSLQML